MPLGFIAITHNLVLESDSGACISKTSDGGLLFRASKSSRFVFYTIALFLVVVASTAQLHLLGVFTLADLGDPRIDVIEGLPQVRVKDPQIRLSIAG